jgi:hypothetical protein
MTAKSYFILLFCLLVSLSASSQALPQDSKLVNFHVETFNSQPEINQWIATFTQETSIPVTVVLTYAYHLDGYHEFIKKWQGDRNAKGVLIILNPFAVEIWENYVDIIPSSTIHIAPADIDNLKKYSVMPIFEKKPWVNQGTGEVSPDIFSKNQMIVEAVKQMLIGLRSVAYVKDNISAIPKSLANADGSFTFMTPSGDKIVLPAKAGNVYFYQKVNGDETQKCVAGTLAGFRIGYDEYSAIINNGMFQGYRAGSKKYTPPSSGISNQSHPHVILGLVCVDFFKYLRFNATEANNPESTRKGSLSFYSNASLPILSERHFPVKFFTGTVQPDKQERSRGHEKLLMTQLRGVEYQLMKDRCEYGEIIPLAKIGQIAVKHEDYFRGFVNVPEQFFMPLIDWNGFKRIMAGADLNKLGAWVKRVNEDPALQQLYSSDKYKFYSITVDELFKFLDEQFTPPVLVDNDNLVFVTPAGSKIVLPKRVKKIKFFQKSSSEEDLDVVLGTLTGFSLDNKTYEAAFGGGNFQGYKSGSSTYTPAGTVPASSHIVMGFPDSKEGIITKGDFDYFQLVKFKDPGIPSFTGGEARIKGIAEFPLQPFSSAFPAIEQIRITSEKLGEQPLVEYSGEEFTGIEKDLINDYRSTPALLPAFTAAQYLNQYKSLGSIFTRLFNEWPSSLRPSMYYWDELMYRSQSLKGQWEGDKHSFYLEFLKSFKSQVDRWHNFSKKQFLSRVTGPKSLMIPHWDVTIALKKFTPNDFAALTKEERVNLLILLTRKDLIGGTYEMPEAVPSPVPITFSLEGGETIALKIVQGTVEKDQPYVLDALVREREGRDADQRRFLIHALCEDFDGPEFVQFTQTVVNWVSKHRPPPASLTIDAVVEESTDHFKMAMPFNPKVWSGSAVSKDFRPDGKIELIVSYQKWNGETTTDRRGNDIAVYTTIQHTLVGDPYQYFILEFKDELRTEHEYYRKGQRVRVPMLYGYLLFNDLNLKKLNKSAKLAVDLFLIGVGIGELRAGWSLASALGKTRLLIDNGINIAGAVMSQGLEDELKNSNSPEAKAFLDAWWVLNFYSNIGSAYTLAESFVEAASKLRKSNGLTHPGYIDEVNWITGKVEAEFKVKADAPSTVPTMRMFGLTKLDERRFQMSPEVRSLFDETFGSKIEHLKKFERNIDMVDAWSVVKGDDVFKGKFTGNDKTNFEDLEKIASYIKQNPDQLQKLSEELTTLRTTSGKLAWVRGLETFAAYPNIEAKLAGLTTELRLAFRNDYGSSGWTAMRDVFHASPELIEAWLLLRKHNPHTSNTFIFNSNIQQLTDDLRRVSNHLTSSGRKLSDITAEFDALADYKARRSWIDALPMGSSSFPNIARKVNSLDPEIRAEFWADFNSSVDKLRQIEEKGSSVDAMIDAWLITRSRTGSRTDVDVLSSLAEYLVKRNHTDKVAALTQEFNAAIDKDGWLRSIPFYTRYPDLDNRLYSFSADQRITFRNDFKGATEERFKSFNDDLHQVEAWRLLSNYASSRTKSSDLKRVADHVRVNSNRVATIEAELRVLKDRTDENNVPVNIDTWLEGLSRLSSQARLETKLASLTPADRIRFRNDAGKLTPTQATPLVSALNNEPELLDAWVVLSDHASGRLVLRNLHDVSSYLTKSGKSVTSLRDEYRAITSESGRTRWIEGLAPRWIKEEVLSLTGKSPKFNDDQLRELVVLGKTAHQYTDEDMLAFALLHSRKPWVSLEGMKLVLQAVDEGKRMARGRFAPPWDYMKVYREVQHRAISGKTLDPKQYIDPDFYSKHLSQFNGRASYLLNETQRKMFVDGKAALGRETGLVMATKEEIDRVIAEAGTSIAELEKLLGFSPGWWQNKGRIYRVDILNPESRNLRFQNGTEEAANEFYTPGGFTSGGVREAVTDQVPNNCTCAHVELLPQFGGIYYTNLETKLGEVSTKLGNAGSAVKNQFDADFRSSEAHLKAFDANPAMVDAWLIIKDIDPRMKSDVKALDAIANYVKNNGLRVEGLKRELASIAGASDYVKSEWLSGLTAFAPFGNLEGHLSTLDASVRIALRNDFKTSPVKDVLANLQTAVNADPKILDAWRVLRDVSLPSVKHNVENLKKVRTYLNKTGESIDALKGKVPSSNVQSWIDNLRVSAAGALSRLSPDSRSSISISAERFDRSSVVWIDPVDSKLHTAFSFMNETGNSLYDVVLPGGFYVKFDYNDGRILLANTNGDYHAFGVINGAMFKTFKDQLTGVSAEAFDYKVANFLNEHAEKLKVLSGVTPRSITVKGEAVTLSRTRPNTFLGRFRPDIQAMFEEFGSYKNVGLGEKAGGIHILNKPDFYGDGVSWWDAYNKPWLEEVIKRQDNIILATIPGKADEIIVNGKLLGAYAQELNFLSQVNYKPSNISDTKWAEIRGWLGYK